MRGIQKVIIISLLAILPLKCIAQINFEDISLQEALSKSATNGKPVLLMLYQSTCGHCEKMLKEVMTDTAVFEFYNLHFINKKVEMLTEPDAQKYAKQFYVQSFPTFVILDKNAEVLFQYVGEFKSEDFLNIAQLALKPEHQLPNLRDQYLSNKADSNACYNYLLALSRGRLATQPIANMYFNAIRDSFEYSAFNWKIFSMSVSDMGSEIFQFISTHRNEFAEVATIKKVERKLYLTAAYNLQVAASANDTSGFKKIKTLALELKLHQVDSMVFITSLNLYEKNKSWGLYVETAVAGAEKFVWNDAMMLRRLSERIQEYSNDKTQLQKGANFAVRSADLKPDYHSNLSAAKIYLKMGYKEYAKKYAEIAKKYGLEHNLNVSEANLVIQQTE